MDAGSTDVAGEHGVYGGPSLDYGGWRLLLMMGDKHEKQRTFS